MTIELGSELVPVQTGSKRCLKEKRTTYEYVPLLDGLHSLLSKAEILEEVSVNCGRWIELLPLSRTSLIQVTWCLFIIIIGAVLDRCSYLLISNTSACMSIVMQSVSHSRYVVETLYLSS